MNRYICVHGHFYQPPRENPWLEAIEVQESAQPWHDWNERVTDECYARTAAARVLDSEGRIIRIVNLYSRISFNVGPTLLSWMQEAAPEVYAAILEADRESRKRFGGHGSALAQAYNHLILPLANRRDKVTQVAWGIRDFKHRFGRPPEGMWLPETAVDLESLDILAEQGIRFTILSPYQARRVRRLGSEDWQDAADGRVDPTMPYEVMLPSGRRISVFFYDGPVSRAIAFERLLDRGEHLAHRIMECFTPSRSGPQLAHVATDGETYGHHHRFGEMALAYALQFIEENKLAEVVNYGAFLERFPPTHEAEIAENTSWSCSHGIERWRGHCGCNAGTDPSWNQSWRSPLREALDGLRDAVAPRFEERTRALLKDPWAARDDYISMILDRSEENRDRFLERHAVRVLSDDEKVVAFKLLELQRNAMLMYTSCGWFFDDVSGIETVQVMRYAARIVQLAGQLFGGPLEEPLLRKLERARSNRPDRRNGRWIYEREVKPGVLDLRRVAAHYAVSSLFESYGDRVPVYCFQVHREDHKLASAGNARMAVGRARIVSRITGASARFTFGVIHLGDHNLSGGVRKYQGPEAYEKLVHDLTEAFGQGDLAGTVRRLDQHFGAGAYSLKLMFAEEQRKVLGQILQATMEDTEALYRQIYDRYAPLMRFLGKAGMPLPPGQQMAAGFVLNSTLQRELESGELRPDRIRALLDEVSATGVELDSRTLGHALQRSLDRAADRFRARPGDQATLNRLAVAVDLAQSLPFEVDLARAQDVYYRIVHTVYPGIKAKAEQGGNASEEWRNGFRSLGGKLRVNVE